MPTQVEKQIIGFGSQNDWLVESQCVPRYINLLCALFINTLLRSGVHVCLRVCKRKSLEKSLSACSRAKTWRDGKGRSFKEAEVAYT